MLKQHYLAILPYGEIAENMTDVGNSSLNNLHIPKEVLVGVVTDFFTQFTQVHPDRLTLQDRTVLMSLLTQGKHYGLSDALYSAHIEEGVFIPETFCIPVILNFCSVVYQYIGPHLINFYHKQGISPRNSVI